MPDCIAINHKGYLDTFIELGRMNIVKAEERFLIGKNKKGFIFGFKAKVRLETSSNSDIGASALVMPITNLNLDYIMVDKYGIL